MERKSVTQKQKIKRKAKISIETTAIGALASFEDAFGDLWGCGEDYQDLNAEQKKMRDAWMKARSEILNRSENSKRLLLREIEWSDIREPGRYITIIRNKKE